MNTQFVCEVRESADALFSSGFNCAEAVALALTRALGIETQMIPRIATAFCSGMGRTCGTCGAVTGALMGISLMLGRDTPEGSMMPSFTATQQLFSIFEGEFGARYCHDLIGCDLTVEERGTYRNVELGARCAIYTRRAAEIAAQIIADATRG